MEISRRNLLCGALLVALGLTTDAADAAVPAVGISQVGSKLKLDLKKNKGLAKIGGAVIINFSYFSNIAVVRTAKGPKGLVAMSLACTHMGTTVEQQGNLWVCPLHGSKFGLDGKLINGPAAIPLRKFPVSATATTALIG